ncbi:DUF177 domain-containing protein [Spongiivirga sp. MCCC 1A20706]|uniref:YceD family protein n=1 Tax=Spongiivirga sp. MCCC 1A20706 TaxID=3160963 RepID=UPI00397771A6
MKQLKEYNIPFVGLKVGKHQFEYEVGKTFFETFEYDDFNDVNVKVDLLLEKKSNMLELAFTSSGSVNINCDITNEPFDQYTDGALNLVVKFGDEYNDENEELLILPHGEYQINIAQYIYEMIVLSIPSKRIHPGVKDGSLKSDILEKLEELQPKQTDEDSGEIDPRWDTLKKLLTDK